jgi:hypothetical protein
MIDTGKIAFDLSGKEVKHLIQVLNEFELSPGKKEKDCLNTISGLLRELVEADKVLAHFCPGNELTLN